MGYEEARKELQGGYEKSSADLDAKIAAAIKTLADYYGQAESLIKSQEESAITDPARRVSFAATPIRQGIDSLITTLTDYHQRTGGFSGSPKIKTVVDQALSTLVPLASQETKAALEAKQALVSQRAGLKETLGGKTAEITLRGAEAKTGLMSDLSQGLALIETEKGKQDYETRKAEDLIRFSLMSSGALAPGDMNTLLKRLGLSEKTGNYLYNPKLTSGDFKYGSSGELAGETGRASSLTGENLQNISDVNKAIAEMRLLLGQQGYLMPNESAISYGSRQAAYHELDKIRGNLLRSTVKSSGGGSVARQLSGSSRSSWGY